MIEARRCRVTASAAPRKGSGEGERGWAADEPTARTASSSVPWLASLTTTAPRTIGALAAVIAAVIAALFILRARRARGNLQ